VRPGDGGRKGVGRGEGSRDDDDNDIVIVVRYAFNDSSMSLC
jgi:hypothetical protein